MALDGLFLYKLTQQLKPELVGTRVEKIYQPSKDELVFVMRSKQGAKKLYFNARADGARVHLSEQNFINPQNPPMLCMLLRKKFTSAWLDDITQSGFERILCFHFSALNDFGDRVPLSIYCEIMGRYSNVIFTDENNVILDAIKRIGSNKSSVREVLPGKEYILPPKQDKLDILSHTGAQICEQVLKNDNVLLSKALLKVIQGISPLRCNELVFSAYGSDIPVYRAKEDIAALLCAIEKLKALLEVPARGCVLIENGKMKFFSFAEIEQFGSLYEKKYFSSLSEVLDCFYENRVNTVKRTQSGGELFKKIGANIERISKKMAMQKKELDACEDSERLKIYGELINANLYYLEQKVSSYTVFNYYTGEQEVIPADVMLTPAENAAHYYKEYRKKQNAKIYIQEQLKIGEEQLDYLESVLDILERAQTPEEIAALKKELVEQGYLKLKYSKKERTPKELKPLEFTTTGGFKVLVGRNNLSNDKLTFKIAHGNDLWFHTKNIHGSHTLLLTNNRQPGEEDIIEAAGICAYHSKARDNANVPVDFTLIKFVKRQPSKIPGRVFYTDYNTVYVNPLKEEVEKLKSS